MKILWKYGKTDIADCYLVRKKVFVDEQGFDGEAEFDNLDSVSYHLAIYNDKENPASPSGETTPAIATARLFLSEDGYHCGRICVLSEYRKKGIGLMVMQAIEEKTRELGGKSLCLSAQVRVAAFYEKAGYIRYGEEYLDEFCPHIAMKKEL